MFEIFGLELTPNQFLYGCLGIGVTLIGLIIWVLYDLWKFKLVDEFLDQENSAD